MPCRLWVLALTILLSAGSDRAQQQVLPGTSTLVTCTSWSDLPSSVQFCASLGYSQAATPNFRVPPQDVADASRELGDFQPLITTKCSGALVHFLCSFYFPPCFNNQSLVLQTHVLGPCYSMCEMVRRECASIFQAYGVPYPPFFNCSLPAFHPADNLCFGPSDPTTLTYPITGGSVASSVRQSAPSSAVPSSLKAPSDVIAPAPTQITSSSVAINISPSVSARVSLTTAPASTLSSATTSKTMSSVALSTRTSTYAVTQPSVTPTVTDRPCYPPSQVPFCANVGYTSGFRLPNPLGDATPLQAEGHLQSFKLFVDMKCSQALIHFLCGFYAPPCEATLPYAAMQPCRNLCEFVRKGCEPAFVKIGMVWPMQFACDEFPDAGGNGTTCYGPANPEDLVLPVTTPSVPTSYANGQHFRSSWIIVSLVSAYVLVHLFLTRPV